MKRISEVLAEKPLLQLGTTQILLGMRQQANHHIMTTLLPTHPQHCTKEDKQCGYCDTSTGQ